MYERPFSVKLYVKFSYDLGQGFPKWLPWSKVIVWWQTGWTRIFRHIQSFFAVSSRSDPNDYKSVESKVCTLEEFVLWPKLELPSAAILDDHYSTPFCLKMMIQSVFSCFRVPEIYWIIFHEHIETFTIISINKKT